MNEAFAGKVAFVSGTLLIARRSRSGPDQLFACGNTEQLRFHLQRAKENGGSEAELIQAITVAKKVFKK